VGLRLNLGRHRLALLHGYAFAGWDLFIVLRYEALYIILYYTVYSTLICSYRFTRTSMHHIENFLICSLVPFGSEAIIVPGLIGGCSTSLEAHLEGREEPCRRGSLPASGTTGPGAGH
jgi:hypothetical protein